MMKKMKTKFNYNHLLELTIPDRADLKSVLFCLKN